MSSTEIIRPHNHEVRQVNLGEWSIQIGPEVHLGNESNLKGFLTHTLRGYKDTFAPTPGTEHAYYRMHGVSSPIVRIDMPLVTDGVSPDQGIFEVEARPAGLGIAAEVFPDLTQYFVGATEQVQSGGHEVAVKVLPYVNAPQHDSLTEKARFADSIGVPIYGPGEHMSPQEGVLYYVYGDSPEAGDNVEAFERQSLFPVRDDGNKDYLIQMGLAEAATPELVAQKLHNAEPFVMKPAKGMWAQDFFVKTPGGRDGRINGRSTNAKIEAAIAQNPTGYLTQPLHMPGRMQIGGSDMLAMARVFALHNPATGDYEPIGGMYVARNNIRLHGTSDAITGQIVFPQ